MLQKVYTSGLNGVDGFEVTVECNCSNRLPRFDVVGLPDTAVKEAKERIKAALDNSGFEFPDAEITVNLAPADRKKQGSSFDLAIAVGLLGGFFFCFCFGFGLGFDFRFGLDNGFIGDGGILGAGGQCDGCGKKRCENECE